MTRKDKRSAYVGAGANVVAGKATTRVDCDNDVEVRSRLVAVRETLTECDSGDIRLWTPSSPTSRRMMSSLLVYNSYPTPSNVGLIV